jgi:CrcB protein
MPGAQDATAWVARLLLIGAGGAVGAVLRYLLAGWVQTLALAVAPNRVFPLGTLVVNVLGSLLLGFLMPALTGVWLVREEWRLGLTVGVLGGFTTFSTFAYESLTLAQGRAAGTTLANILLSNGLGLTAVWLGYRCGVKWLGA